MHQRLDRISILSSGKFLALCLASCNNRNCEIIFYKTLVDFPHHLCTLFRFLVCRVDRVSLLPQELSGTEERSCSLLPAENRTPLVPHLRQVTVGLHGLAPHVAEQRLGCRADAETLLKRLHSAVCHPCHLGSKALDMVFFFLEQTLRDQDRKIYIFHSRLFKASVKIRLNILPQRIAVRQVIQTSFYA